MEKQAELELNSTVFIAPIGTPLKTYEKDLNEALDTYRNLLRDLEKIYTN